MEPIEAKAERNGAQAKNGTAEQAGSGALPRTSKWSAVKARVERVWTHLEVAFRDLTSRTARSYSRWMNPPANK